MNEGLEKNILGTELTSCCTSPMTGFFRDGLCRTNAYDLGTHVVCAVVTEAFLAFTSRRGNDLTTARPESQFPGLKPGDGWCLCVNRWIEAHMAGVAPSIDPKATHERTLQFVPLEVLEPYFIQT